MGLDITLRKFIGYTEKGYLDTESVDEPDWCQDRLAIRHEISKNIDFEVLKSDKYYDLEEYYRPSNFEKAYSWAETLKTWERDYIKNILDILKKNDNYYLNYCY